MTERTCPQCNTSFEPDHPGAKWCSDDCRWAWNAVRKGRTLQVCAVCDRRFQPSGRGRPRKTCSRACAARAHRAKSRTPRQPEGGTSSFPQGSCHGPAQRLMEGGQELDCGICGQPAGDDSHLWQILEFRCTPKVQEKPVAICPLHRGTDPRLLREIINLGPSSRHGEDEIALEFPEE